MAALRPRNDYAPFGWCVPACGHKPSEVRADVRRLALWASERWCAYFPEEQGYEVQVTAPAGPSNGVQLAVRRGDFQASVAIESILNPARRVQNERVIRMFGRAESGALRAAESSRFDVVLRFRSAGLLAGLVSFFVMCWLALGVSEPVYVLGGLMVAITGLLSVMAGGMVGDWLGERIAEGAHARALAEAEQDERLHDDLRRWAALVRQFAAQRTALEGQGPAPFRALSPAEPAEPTKSELARFAPPVLTFSSL